MTENPIFIDSNVYLFLIISHFFCYIKSLKEYNKENKYKYHD